MARRAVFAALLTLLALSALGACGGHKQTEPTQACASAAQRAVDAMINQTKKRLDKPGLSEDTKQRILARAKRQEGTGAKMRGAITNRCVEDKWPAAVVDCWNKADDLEAIRTCRKQLPPDAQARLQKDELETFVDGGDATPNAGDATADRRLELLNQAITDAEKQLADAKSEAEVASAKAHLAALREENKRLQEQIDAMRGSAAPSP